jgi:hypothetical protein
MSRRLIRTDGTEVNFDKPIPHDEIRRLIGARTIDVVSLRHLGPPLQVMCVDDQGYEVEWIEHSPGHFEQRPTKALKPVNRKATELYWQNCVPGTTHEIVGDVVITFDNDWA